MPVHTHCDEVEIWQLATRYAIALDTRNWEMLSEIFADDAIMDFAGIGERQGPAQIVEVCAQALEPLDASQHLVGSHLIDTDGDRATARCYFQAQHVRADAADGEQYIVAGTYVDELRRTGDGWRIRRRTQTVTWTSGNPGVLTS